MDPCPKCGSKEPPIPEPEVMPNGELGAGVVYVCPDCGYLEM